MLRQKLRQNSYQFSCRYSQRFSEASAWAVYHLGEWDEVSKTDLHGWKPTCATKPMGYYIQRKWQGFPPRKDLLPFPPILQSIHGAKPKFGRHQTRQLLFLGTFGWQCLILRHPHSLEDTQFNKVSQLHRNDKDPTKVKHREECSLVQRVDIQCIFNHIHWQTVARMNLAWTFHCWHFERHKPITIALEQLLNRKAAAYAWYLTSNLLGTYILLQALVARRFLSFKDDMAAVSLAAISNWPLGETSWDFYQAPWQKQVASVFDDLLNFNGVLFGKLLIACCPPTSKYILGEGWWRYSALIDTCGGDRQRRHVPECFGG